jgi:hypothetical protein
MTKDCRNCKFWSFDMDMDPFCVHPNANGIGTSVNAMRGKVKTPNMRGEPCGPDAKFFKPAKRAS